MKKGLLCLLVSQTLFLCAQVCPQGQEGARKRITAIEEKTGIKLLSIPARTFTMGSADGEPDELPVRRVRVGGFWMSRDVITVEQYRRYCAATKVLMPDETKFNLKWVHIEHPILHINWNEAKAYCAWAGKGVDLPTEAEWEVAARGGLEGKHYPWGDKFDGSKLQHSVGRKSGGTARVGTYPANGYGLHDMAGNVWQWCLDYYAPNYDPNDTDNPKGPKTGVKRVLRGGSWGISDASLFRCALRYFYKPVLYAPDDFGFRVVFHPLK